MAQLTDQRADEGRGRGIALHPLDPLTPAELAGGRRPPPAARDRSTSATCS